MNKIYPLGDSAVVLEFGSEINEEIHHSIRSVCQFLDEYSFEGFVEYVPAFTTITVFYDPVVSGYDLTASLLQEMLDEIAEMEPGEDPAVIVEIPVLYGGPDLSFVAAHCGLTEEEVIELHTSAEYLVHMVGFAPGFPYLGGLNEKIAVPRKEIPDNNVPAGSVGIGGHQTGIYPIETPGGWQIIGQTPLVLFDAEREQPSLLRAGNRVRFVAIDALEFQMLKGEDDGY